MNEIERKALALVNEVSDGFHDVASIYDIHTAKALRSALCRAIEQHEAFRQQVSDAVEAVLSTLDQLVLDDRAEAAACGIRSVMARFIVAKPDPIAEVLSLASSPVPRDTFVERLAARGLKIVEDK